MIKHIQIFKPGRHVAMSGEAVEFSEADLRATADAYDPKLYEAPLVVGHPAVDAPAYGWTKALEYAEGLLRAEPDQVDAAFAELVRAGRFKRVSASFFKPNAKNNPKPGVYYLRHIGFLGAAAPAVQGLKPVSFASDEDGVVEFGDWIAAENASMWRRMRDWLIEKFGREEADKVVPDFAVTSLTEAATRVEERPALAYSTTDKETIDVDKTEEQKRRDQELEAKKRELDAQAASFAEREAKIREAETRQRRRALADFVGGLVKDGRLLPRHQAPLVEFLAALDEGAVIEFAEGEARVKKPGIEWLRGFLAELPQVVDYSERSGTRTDDAHAVTSFAAPAGYAVDPKRLELHNRALAYQAEHKTTYEAALAAVSR